MARLSMRSGVLRPGLLWWPLFIAACRIPPVTHQGSLAARAEDLLLCRDYDAAAAAFGSLAESSSRPEDRARALLGVARAHIKMGSYRKALDVLYTARRLCDMGPLRESTDRLFGEAAFQNQDYGVARGYLERTLGLSAGDERVRILAQLYVCAERGLDSRSAERYLAEIPTPLDQELSELIQSHLKPAPPSPRPPPPAPEVAQPPMPRKPEPETRSGPVRVLPRGSWNARPVRRNVDNMGKIICLTVHHTGGPTFWGRSAEEAADEIRKIQKVHQTQNRWADIGYHYIIDRAGRVWQGRPLTFQGAHAHGDANRGNIGVVMLGNYLHQEITEAQIRSLRGLVSRLCETYGIPSGRIYTHSEIRDGYTDCPGPAITRVVEKIRRSL